MATCRSPVTWWFVPQGVTLALTPAKAEVGARRWPEWLDIRGRWSRAGGREGLVGLEGHGRCGGRPQVWEL